MDNRKVSITEQHVNQVINILTILKIERDNSDNKDTSYPFHKHTVGLPLHTFFKQALIDLKFIIPTDRVNFMVEYSSINEDQARNIIIKMVNLGKAYGRKGRVARQKAKESKSGIAPEILEHPEKVDIPVKPLPRELTIEEKLESIIENKLDTIITRVLDKVIEAKTNDNLSGLDTDTISVEDGKLTFIGKSAGKDVLLVFKLQESIV